MNTIATLGFKSLPEGAQCASEPSDDNAWSVTSISYRKRGSSHNKMSSAIKTVDTCSNKECDKTNKTDCIKGSCYIWGFDRLSEKQPIASV